MYQVLMNTKALVLLRNQVEKSIWKLHLRRFTSKNLEITERCNSPRNFLICSTIGGNLNILAMDLVLALALKSRGHKVSIVLCGGGFSACMYAEKNKYSSLENFIVEGVRNLCGDCSLSGKQLMESAKLRIVKLSPPSKIETTDSVDDEIAESGAKRFLGMGRTEDETLFDQVLDRFKFATLQFASSINEALVRDKYDVLIAHHGIYVPQALYNSQSRKSAIRFVSWVQGYRRGTYLFSWNDTYHRELLKPFPNNTPLSPSQEALIENYIASRDLGINDWIRFGVTSKSESLDLPIDWALPTAVLLTNVSWDAQLHYESRLFKDMHQWINETIEWFIANPDCNLVIRIHPAEETGRIKAGDKVADFISKNFQDLPKNIAVVGPLEEISTYKLIEKSDLSIIYGSKVGLEVAALGKPLLIAGEAWSRGKGIGIEPKDKLAYFGALEQFRINSDLLYTNRTKGLEVAYYYFFRRLIKIESIRPIRFYPYARPRIAAKWFEKDEGLRAIVNSLENNLEFEL
jgi:predicted peroxiredoxin